MKVRLIACDSLGVRSMCCVVETASRRILIDPGVALAPKRFSLEPHPVELEAAARVRAAILSELSQATDVVISHFHGDHAPMAAPDQSQLPLADFTNHLGSARIWVKGGKGISRLCAERYAAARRVLADRLIEADNRQDGGLTFSGPVPHGDLGGSVLMTLVTDGTERFVHASDMQLLDNSAVSVILSWRPDVLFVAGPPLYLGRLRPAQVAVAWQNSLRLAQAVRTMVIDHHLFRSAQGREWLDQLSQAAGRRVLCGAEFMSRPLNLLEAQRRQLYATSQTSV
ncbi:MAG: hypothetical protein ABIK44_01450 [candidate division WOR-3 bacterium]